MSERCGAARRQARIVVIGVVGLGVTPTSALAASTACEGVKVDITTALKQEYSEDLAEVKAAMFEAFERLKKTEYGQEGVTAFRDSDVVVRARIKTLPGKQWALGRAYNELIKHIFDERARDPVPSQGHRNEQLRS